MTDSEQRKRFEKKFAVKYWRKEELDLSLSLIRTYSNSEVESAWEGWKACEAATVKRIINAIELWAPRTERRREILDIVRREFNSRKEEQTR